MGKTLFDKIYDKHVVSSIPNGPDVFYIDVQYIHEVTSPQAFEGLRQRGIKVARPKQVCATADHNVPTENQHLPIQNDYHATKFLLWFKTVKNLELIYMV